MALSVETLALAKKFAKSYTDSATEGISGGVKYKGAVNYYDLLPASPKLGDAYTVVYKGTSQEAGQVSDGSEYVWGKIDNVAQWILFGVSVPDIPEPTSADNGKMLGVDNGAYTLVAGSSGAAWGSITGTLADQTDLKNALGQYLPLTGGTMTGALKISDSSNAYIKSTNDRDVLRASANGGSANVYLGNNQPGSRAEIQTGTRDVTHLRGSMQYDMLDSYNTAANVPLAGTEADLTSLKLNGMTYKVPSGGGGSAWTDYTITISAATNTSLGCTIIKADQSHLTQNATITPQTPFTFSGVAFVITAISGSAYLNSLTNMVALSPLAHSQNVGGIIFLPNNDFAILDLDLGGGGN